VYDEISRGIVRDLAALGLVVEVREQFPYCAGTSQYVAGGFLLGKCPHCSTATAGYFCEACGLLSRPEAIAGAQCGLDGCEPDWRDVPCLYARLPRPDAVLARMASMGVPDEFHDIVRTYLAAAGPLLRLTQPGTWGVPCPVPGSPVDQVTFTYVVGGLAFWLLCAEIGDTDGVSALDGRSGTRTIASFGLDNSLPFLLGGLGMAMVLPDLKPLDHVLLNHFMTLDGSKFSTSRDHVIWSGDLARAPETCADAVRAYLAGHSPDRTSTDFSLADFHTYRETVLYGQWQAVVDRVWGGPEAGSGPADETGGGSAAGAPARLLARLEELLRAQSRALDPTSHDLPAAVATIQSWVDDGESLTSGGVWWLAGLALLACPVLPDFAARLWHALGRSGRPLIDGFTHLTPYRAVDAAPTVWSMPYAGGETTCATR
jgi:methionyl-tRNA synthetase